MQERRKQIILSEIKYWKQNNLLPAHYCDFLLALYGNGNETGQSKTSSSLLHKSSIIHKLSVLLIIIISVLLSLTVQMINNEVAIAIGGISVGLLIGYAIFTYIKRNNSSHLIYIASAFLLLQISMKLWNLFFIEQPMILIGLLILNCLFWLMAGRLLKLLYFTLSGMIGLLCIIIFLILQF